MDAQTQKCGRRGEGEDDEGKDDVDGVSVAILEVVFEFIQAG